MSFVVRGSFGEDTLHYIETHNHHIFLPDSSRVQMREKLQEIILTEER